MQLKVIEKTIILNCTPDKAYHAWMDSHEHSKMIGEQNDTAKIDPKVDGQFSIWDGAITGKTLELDPKNFIIEQEWRYDHDDWPIDEPSEIKIEFLETAEGKTEMVFSQTGVPEQHLEKIETGWEEYYWKPMQEYFNKNK